MKRLKLILMSVALVVLAMVTSWRPAHAYDATQIFNTDTITVGAVTADGICTNYGFLIGKAATGYGDVTVMATAYKDANNVRSFSRRFIVTSSNGVLSVSPVSKADDGPMIGWSLLFASVGLRVDPNYPDAGICATTTGVAGATIAWHTRIHPFWFYVVPPN